MRPFVFVQQVLWGTLTLSLVVYGGVAYALAEPGAARELPQGLTLALAIVACGTAAFGFVVPRIFLSDDKLRAAFAAEASPETLLRALQPGSVDPERLREIEQLSPHERRLLRLPALAFMPLVLRLVLHESIGIYGLVLSFLSRRFEPVLPFLIAAIALNLLARPPLRKLAERAALLAP